MDQLTREIIVGAVSSLIGAMIVFLGQYGLQIGKKARIKAKEKRNEEINKWKTNDPQYTQEITNHYLFGILRYLFLGNLFWIVPEIVLEPMHVMNVSPIEVSMALTLLTKGSALFVFYLGLGKILKYLRFQS